VIAEVKLAERIGRTETSIRYSFTDNLVQPFGELDHAIDRWA
jgi:hypothetical protein